MSLTLKQRIAIKNVSNSYPEWKEDFIKQVLLYYDYNDKQAAEQLYDQVDLFNEAYIQYEKNQNFSLKAYIMYTQNNKINKTIEFQVLNEDQRCNYIEQQQLSQLYLEYVKHKNQEFCLIENSIQQPQNNQLSQIWPKYIGSLQTGVRLQNDITDTVQMEFNQELYIQFQQIKYICEEKQIYNQSYTNGICKKLKLEIDCENLRSFVKTKRDEVLGEFCHKFSFVWNILVNLGVLDLRVYYQSKKEDIIQIKLDIYLKQANIFDKIELEDEMNNIAQKKLSQNLTVQRQQVESALNKQYLQESLNFILAILNLKVTTRALLTPTHKYKNLIWIENQLKQSCNSEPYFNIIPNIFQENQLLKLYYNIQDNSIFQKNEVEIDELDYENSTENESADQKNKTNQNKNLKEEEEEGELEEEEEEEQRQGQIEEEKKEREEEQLLQNNAKQNQKGSNSLIEDEEEEEEDELLAFSQKQNLQKSDSDENRLNQDEINKILKITSDNHASQFRLQEQPQGLVPSLLDYQQQGLTWMLYRENFLSFEEANTNFNGDQAIPQQQRKLGIFWAEIQLIDGTILYFNYFSGILTNQFVQNQEQSCNGGILADEMGLGKTVMSLSLILANPLTEDYKTKEILIPQDTNENKKLISSKKEANQIQNLPQRDANLQKQQINLIRAGTLIVVPKSLIQQWISEIEKHIEKGKLIYLDYYDQKVRLEGDLHMYDIVITTYNILGIEYQNYKNGQHNKGSKLFCYKWHRIILDEGHIIKGKSNNCSQGAYNIVSDYRWVLSGTPLQNKLDDIYSLVHFLKIDVFENYQWWNKYINKNENKEEVFGILANILNPILLRRTKKQKNGENSNLLKLPPKKYEKIVVKFDEEEERLYNSFYLYTKHQFEEMLKKPGQKKQFLHIFAILQRLRQICDHPILVFNKPINFFRYQQLIEQIKENKIKNYAYELQTFFDQNIMNLQNNLNSSGSSSTFTDFSQEQIQKILLDNNGECCICLDSIKNFQNPTVIQCGHIMHSKCLNQLQSTTENAPCPQCRQIIRITKVIFPSQIKVASTKKYEEKNKVYNEQQRKKSSKIKAIMQEIQVIKKKREKCILYTQWLSFMDIIENELTSNRIRYQRIDGTMTVKQREDAIKAFSNDLQYTVFLISLKAGCYGLNLVAANHVLICDPWWNPAVEEQASDRCHRIGQTKPVFVKNFICKNSIEERILQLQEVKRQLIANTITNSVFETNQTSAEDDLKFLFEFSSGVQDNNLE